MSGTPITLDQAVELTRTGDVWLFRGRSVADRAIQLTTNSPVNHVGMAVVVEDLPPLMWHAELGRSLPDLWSGTHQRGVQLHDLRSAVMVWASRYGQRAWLRQLERPLPDPAGTGEPVTREMEDAVLRTVARLDGTPFPSTTRLAWRWLRGRTPAPARPAGRVAALEALRARIPTVDEVRARLRGLPDTPVAPPPSVEAVYCAEVVAMTYQAMGLLPGARRSNWFDAGRFWSGDELGLESGYRLGAEVAVRVPPGMPPGTTPGRGGTAPRGTVPRGGW